MRRVVLLILCALLTGCSLQPEVQAGKEEKMIVEVNGQSFTVKLENNVSVEALMQWLEEEGTIELTLDDYGGFEKSGELGRTLPSADTQTHSSNGDIVLYQSRILVLFYGSNSWSYTRIGKVENLEGWSEALGSGSVHVQLSMGKSDD